MSSDEEVEQEVLEESNEDHDSDEEEEQVGEASDDGEANDGEGSEGEETKQVEQVAISLEKSFDLGMLACFDPSNIQPPDGKSLPDYINEVATAGTQSLLHRIFDLPTRLEKGQTGRIVTLPKALAHLPREKPLPTPKEPTKWEKFAKEKGIHKKKKSVKEFDEASGEYKRKFGYDKANNVANDWLMEDKGQPKFNDDGSVVDPYTRLSQEKAERVAKNKKQQDRNLAAAEGRRTPGTIDLTSAVQAAPGKRNQKEKKQKHHVDVALAITQRATASMGKFDSVCLLIRRHSIHSVIYSFLAMCLLSFFF
jgi:regulator of ribosome biosynthesis